MSAEFEDEMAEELHSHIEMRANELERGGLPRKVAERRARIEFGGGDKYAEACREAARGPVRIRLRSALQDARHAWRGLRRAPGFSLVVAATLALGIGVNAAIFALAYSVLWRPLPYRAPSGLLMVHEVVENYSAQPLAICASDISILEHATRVFSESAAFRVWGFELSGGGEPMRITGERAGSSLFSLLGVKPMLGRGFTSGEEAPGHDVVVLTYALWQSRFGGDRSVLGRRIELDRRPYTVIGVLPRDFTFPLPGMGQGVPAELFVPLALRPEELADVGDNYSFGMLARARPGLGQAAVDANLQTLSGTILDTYRAWAASRHLSAIGLRLDIVTRPLEEEIREPYRPVLLVLLAAAGLVLLIALVNACNLQLTRAAGRERELAVRLALGAGRVRLLQQFLAEGLLLGIAGGVAGGLAASLMAGALAARLPAALGTLAATTEGTLAPVVFTLVISLATGALLGLLPALAPPVQPGAIERTLRRSGPAATTAAAQQRMRAGFVVAEIALAAMLLVGAGLLLRSFSRLVAVSPGFRPARVLTASLDLPPEQYQKDEQATAFFHSLLVRLRAAPGVAAVGFSTDLPLQGQWTHTFSPEGWRGAGANFNVAYHSVVYGDYLRAMGIPLLQGRYFDARDQAKSNPVLIVSESLARTYWPGQSALGKRLKWGGIDNGNSWMTVVGVVGDVKQGALDAAVQPHTYQPYEQQPVGSLRVAIRGENDVNLAGTLRAAVAALDPRLAVGKTADMTTVMERGRAPHRFQFELLGAFATLALALAALGVYSVLAYAVTRRTAEIGLRMALGASRSAVLRLVIGQAIWLALVGLCAGLAMALATRGLLRPLLFDTSAADAATYATVPAVLALVVIVACLLPVLRALRIPPASALRAE